MVIRDLIEWNDGIWCLHQRLTLLLGANHSEHFISSRHRPSERSLESCTSASVRQTDCQCSVSITCTHRNLRADGLRLSFWFGRHSRLPGMDDIRPNRVQALPLHTKMVLDARISDCAASKPRIHHQRTHQGILSLENRVPINFSMSDSSTF